MVGTYVAVGVMLAIGFAIYMLLLMSPELLNKLLQDVIKCEDFPGYLSPSSTLADNVECSEHKYMSSSLDSSIDNNLLKNTTLSTAQPGFTSNSSGGNGELAGTGMVVETQPNPEKKIRVLVGIFMMAWNIKQRHLLRMAYGFQTSKDADFTIRFIMGALEDSQAYFKAEVERDNTTFGDIVVLNCTENVDDGKTFTYFSSLGFLVGNGNHDYVMKADDDSYIRLENLGKALRPLPRMDLYYGYSLPCGNEDPYTGWMAGGGYLVSWDLVEWIAESPIPRNRSVGVEDQLTRDWFDEGGVATNRATSFGLFYDHPERAGNQKCAHELSLDSILVHKVKTVEQWLSVLAFFLTARSN
ncbi:unnamed protein product [Calypogeia fissa]